MGLGTLVIVLVFVAIGLGLLNRYGPTYLSMDGKILRIINIVVVIAVVFWLLLVFGVIDFIIGSLNQVHVGRK